MRKALCVDDGEGNEDTQPRPHGGRAVAGVGSSSRPKPKRVTKMSNVALYENRMEFDFAEDAGPYPHFPDAEEPLRLHCPECARLDFGRDAPHF